MAAISLFPKRQETSLIYFSYLALPVCVVLLILNWEASFWFNQTIMALACVMFLNSVHHGMAVATLLSVDEFKQLIKEKNARRKVGFWPVFLFIFFGAALSYLLLKKIVPMPAAVYGSYFLIWSIAEFSTSQWHQVSQTKGLSLLYNRAISAGEVERAPNRWKFERAERLLFDSLVILLAITTLGGFLEYPPLRVAGFIACAAISLGIVAIGFLTPGSKRSFKPQYSLRVLFYPLSSYSYYGAIATRINHGMEYLFVFLRVLGKTTSSRRKVIATTIFFGSIAGILALYNYHTGILPLITGNKAPTLLHEEIFQALAFGRSISHYYVDRTLFSFRHEENRRLVAPFFAHEHAASTAGDQETVPEPKLLQA